jgi:ribosomal protein L11 methyltransferase
MAFGTGTHETTKLCLRAIDSLYEPGHSFLDVGTGTGVLAIAAAKLGGEGNILAYETDADSIKIARVNGELNGVGDRIRFIHGTIDELTGCCDMVCANLTLDVISPILPLLVRTAKRCLVLSGILVEQQDQIVEELSKLGIADPRIDIDGEWIAIIVCPV